MGGRIVYKRKGAKSWRISKRVSKGFIRRKGPLASEFGKKTFKKVVLIVGEGWSFICLMGGNFV